MIVVAAACYMSYGFGKLWAEWRQATQPVAARDSMAADLNSMAAIVPLAGQWSFAELDWNLRSSIVATEDVAARLETLAASTGGDAAKQLPDLNEELVELATGLKIRPVERGGNQIYALDRSDLKARLVVRMVAGRPKVIALAAAYPQSDNQWQLLECTPRGSTGNSDAAAPHLVPLPEGAERNGGRFADDGRLLLELISLHSNADALLSTWRNAGWEVRPSGMGGPDDFSYLCARGDEVVYAWSADPHDALENLMLVRTPGGSDTKARSQ